jgi:hypothetical protein
MEINAQPVTAVSLPTARDGPLTPGGPSRRLVTTRTDATLAVHDLDRLAAAGPHPIGLGDGTWLTTSPRGEDVSVWRLPSP